MSNLQFHNTLKGKVETFKPLEEGKVSLYVCGITPYDEPHVGHARCYVVFDVLRRLLEHEGLAVRHIQNFTDVDDKIIERSNKEKADPKKVAEKNIESYFKWMDALNIKRAHLYPKVTQSIDIIIELIQKIMERGLAYESNGTVYFSVRKFPPYGQLSKRKIDDLDAGARVEVSEEKKDPLDFALWKKSKKGEPFWDSPWGLGRPGWHIECSAMSMKELGETFDIHGGGQDLIFPHHENEIAQSNGATGNDFGFARHWVHNGFVTINKEKMSKSLGNFFTLKDVLGQYDPMAVRYFLLSQHYRSPLNFSDQDLTAAQTAWRQRVLGAYEKLEEKLKESSQATPGEGDQAQTGKKHVDAFVAALQDDVNTPLALGSLNQFCSQIFKMAEGADGPVSGKSWVEVKTNFLLLLDLLGFVLSEGEKWSEDILHLVKDREAARKNKDWKKADQIRVLLKEKGVLVEDAAGGAKIRKI